MRSRSFTTTPARGGCAHRIQAGHRGLGREVVQDQRRRGHVHSLVAEGKRAGVGADARDLRDSAGRRQRRARALPGHGRGPRCAGVGLAAAPRVPAVERGRPGLRPTSTTRGRGPEHRTQAGDARRDGQGMATEPGAEPVDVGERGVAIGRGHVAVEMFSRPFVAAHHQRSSAPSAAKPGPEADHEPPLAGNRLSRPQGLLQDEEDGRRGHVAVLPQHVARGRHLLLGEVEHRERPIDHVTAGRVEDPVPDVLVLESLHAPSARPPSRPSSTIRCGGRPSTGPRAAGRRDTRSP